MGCVESNGGINTEGSGNGNGNDIIGKWGPDPFCDGNGNRKKLCQIQTHMSHFSYACKTEGKNGISHLISVLCINCLSSIPEYSRIIDYSIIWMCIWCGLLQKLHKIKKSELLNSKLSSKL